MDLKDLIGEKKFKQLQKSHPVLSDLLYVCECETCHRIFYEATLRQVQERLLDGSWDVKIPDLWYVAAGRHWVSMKWHSIRVLIEDPKTGDHTLVKDLSKEWSKGAKRKGLTDQQLLEELDRLEALRKSKQK